MKLSFAELHSPIFHAGKNFRDKVFADMEIELDLITIQVDNLTLPFVLLTYKGKPTYLPMTSISHITGKSGMINKPINPHHTQDLTKFQGAQVETPHSHVFEGQGKGRGREKVAKVQGE